jgi:hypothetical protein
VHKGDSGDDNNNKAVHTDLEVTVNRTDKQLKTKKRRNAHR